MYAKSAVMNITAKDDCFIQEDALDANTMKAVWLGLCCKLKFSNHLAFNIYAKKKGMSSLGLSQEFELKQKACWDSKERFRLQ